MLNVKEMQQLRADYAVAQVEADAAIARVKGLREDMVAQAEAYEFAKKRLHFVGGTGGTFSFGRTLEVPRLRRRGWRGECPGRRRHGALDQ